MRILIMLISLISLNGCVGLFITDANPNDKTVTDTRTRSQIWYDNNLELEITAMGNKAPFIDNVRVIATSYNGIVVLIGQATTAEYKQQFEDLVTKKSHVTTVHNQMKVKRLLNFGRVSQDTWLTTKVKSELLTESQLNSSKIRVITEDRDVFLFGYVTTAQADKATNVVRNISGVKHVIRGFQYPATPQVPKQQTPQPQLVQPQVAQQGVAITPTASQTSTNQVVTAPEPATVTTNTQTSSNNVTSSNVNPTEQEPPLSEEDFSEQDVSQQGTSTQPTPVEADDSKVPAPSQTNAATINIGTNN